MADDWTAVHDLMPGKNKLLTVAGILETPTGGWKTSLERATNQGINPLVLELVVIAIKPPDSKIVTQPFGQAVTYEEPTDVLYTDAHVQPHPEVLRKGAEMKVQNVH